MSEAPERIWITGNASGSWNLSPARGGAIRGQETEYVRADLARPAAAVKPDRGELAQIIAHNRAVDNYVVLPCDFDLADAILSALSPAPQSPHASPSARPGRGKSA